MKTIKGTVKYIDIETGCWGIIGKHGKKWRPVNMPEQLKKEGQPVEIEAVEILNDMSAFQWGTAIEIKAFTT